MVVIRGLLRERQFIRAPIKSRGLMIIVPARRSRAKVNALPTSPASVGKAFIGPNKLPSS